MSDNKNNKILMIVAIVVLVFGFLVGGGLIARGIIIEHNKTLNIIKDTAKGTINAAKDVIDEAKNTTNDIKNETEKNINNNSDNQTSSSKRAESEIQADIDKLNEEITQKENECKSLDMRDSGWFENHSKCQDQVFDLKKQKSKFETELWRVQNNFDDLRNEVRNNINDAKKQNNEVAKKAEKVTNGVFGIFSSILGGSDDIIDSTVSRITTMNLIFGGVFIIASIIIFVTIILVIRKKNE